MIENEKVEPSFHAETVGLASRNTLRTSLRFLAAAGIAATTTFLSPLDISAGGGPDYPCPEKTPTIPTATPETFQITLPATIAEAGGGDDGCGKGLADVTYSRSKNNDGAALAVVTVAALAASAAGIFAARKGWI